MGRLPIVSTALLLCLAGSGLAVGPGENIIVTPGYPKYPQWPDCAECKVGYWRDKNSIDAELHFELCVVTRVNGRRCETCVAHGIVGELNLRGSPLCSFRIDQPGTYFFRITLITTDAATKKPNLDVVRLTEDTTVKFK